MIYNERKGKKRQLPFEWEHTLPAGNEEETMKEKTCCITGHREIPAGRAAYVERALALEIDRAIEDGFTCFLTGFAEGTDQLFARLVLERARSFPQIRLEGAIPFRGRIQTLRRSPESCALLDGCSQLHILSERYSPGVYSYRNRFMIDRSQRVLAVYDGRQSGGTFSAIQLVLKSGRELRTISPALPQD